MQIFRLWKGQIVIVRQTARSRSAAASPGSLCTPSTTSGRATIIIYRIGEPFQLVLFDHHPDDQPGAFDDGLLSCGSWVREARRLPLLHADRWIRDAADFPALASLPDLPVYLSVDLDVLSEDYARTDWDQGEMTLEELKGALRGIMASRRILGVDLCGGNTPEKGASPEDLALNTVTREALSDLFRDLS